MKNGKTWAKKKERGSMRWVRTGNWLSLQWIDNKVVTIVYTIDKANDYIEVKRKVKVNDVWNKVDVKKPFVVHRYNTYMNGVDKSDQNNCFKEWHCPEYHRKNN